LVFAILTSSLIFLFNQIFFYLLLYSFNMLYIVNKRVHFWAGYAAINAVTGCMIIADIFELKEWTWEYIFPGILIALITPAVMRVQEQWNQKWKGVNEELAEANKRVEELIKERERDRIARDLHDTVGQTLSTISVKSDISMKLLYQDQKRTEQEIRDIQHLSRSLLQEMREIVSDMKRVTLKEELESAHRRLLEASIAIQLESPIPKLQDSTKEMMLAYVVKEAVTNIIRHSGASECAIRFMESEQELCLELMDNGSFHMKKLQEGNGLSGIRTRVSLMKGTVQIHARAKGGMHMVVRVPLHLGGRETDDTYAVSG
jgi:two-component system, NarL family, sensor histidine kinase DesK